MDYNWLENVPSGATPMPVYQPDFSFLQSMQMRADMQYEQGLSQVKNVYASIFNQPVIGAKAKDVQMKYAQSAQDQMKDISAADLSDPKNVAAAEGIMAPFYQDQNLLTNISYAKYYDAQDGTLDGWQHSTDKDIRSQYNDEMRTALQYKRQEIANAPFSRDAYNKIEKIAATPYYDINADVDKAYKDEQNKGVDNVSIIGSGIYTEHNGVKSIDSFRNYYLSKIGDKYDGQLKIHAYVNMSRQRQDILSHNPGMSPIEVDHQFANENIASLSHSYATNRDSYNKIGDYWEKRAKDILTDTRNGKTASPEQMDKVKFYMQQSQAHREVANQYDSKYQDIGGGDPSSDKYKRFFTDLYEHPEQYISSIDKQIKADNWAKGMAYMNTSEKVELDPVTEAYTKHREENAKLAMEQNKINATLRGQNLSWQKETGRDLNGNLLPGFRPDQGGWFTDTKAGKGAAGTGGLNPDGTPNNSAWTPLGINTTDVAHLSADVIKQQQSTVANDINRNIFDPQTGLATAFKLTGVLNQNELIDFNNMSNKLAAGGKLTDDQLPLFNKVKAELQDKGVDVSNISTSSGLQGALIKYATRIASDLKNTTVGDNLVQKHAMGTQLAVTAGKLQQSMTLYNKNQDAITNIQEEQIKKDEYKKLAYIDPTTGKPRPVTPQDMERDFPAEVELQESSWLFSRQLKDDNDPHIKRLTSKDLATMFYAGKFNPTKKGSWGWGSKDIEIDGKKYDVVAVRPGPKDDFIRDPASFAAPANQSIWDRQNTVAKKDNPAANTFNNYVSGIHNRYGTSEHFAKSMNDFNQNLYKNLDVTKNGMVTPRYGLDPSDDKTNDLASAAGKEMGSISVVPTIFNADGVTPADDEDQKSLRQVLSNTASMKNYVAQIYRTNTASGAPAYGVVINKSSTDKDRSGSVDFLKPTYILPVASLSNAPILSSIPEKTSFLYDDMYDPTKKIEADPITKGYGQNFIVRGVDPGPDGKATAAYVMLYNSHPDQSGSGKIVQEPEKAYKIPLIGANAKNSEEIMNFVYGRVNVELNKSDALLRKIQEDKSKEADAAKYETALQK